MSKENSIKKVTIEYEDGRLVEVLDSGAHVTSAPTERPLEVGDYVVVIDDIYGPPMGAQGVVRAVKQGSLGVEYQDVFLLGHTLQGVCLDGCGWWTSPESLQRQDVPS